MLIDWFTVSAQIINFLVLVWLLKRYLYAPVLLAIDTREKSVADQTSSAETAKADAQKSEKDFLSKSTELDQQKKTLLDDALADANQQCQKLLVQARSEFDALRKTQNESLEKERLEFSREIVKLSCKEVFSVARKALGDLSSATLEATMAQVLVERIKAMSDADRKHFTDALVDTSQAVYVKSTFDLLEPQQTLISDAVRTTFAFERKIQFDTAPDLVCGIELSTQGYKVSWSISDYLNSLESSVMGTQKAENAT